MKEIRKIIRETLMSMAAEEEPDMDFKEAKELAIQRAEEQIELEKLKNNTLKIGKWNEFIRKIKGGSIKDYSQLDMALEDLVDYIKSEEDVYDFLKYGGI